MRARFNVRFDFEVDAVSGELELLFGWAAKDDLSEARVLDRMLLYERRIENSLHKTIKELKRFQIIRLIEIQELQRQCEPSPSLRDETAARRRPAKKQGNLKKQIQYIQALIDAKPFRHRDYDNMPACCDEENKANQSQFHEPALTKGAGEKSVASANLLTGKSKELVRT